MNEDPTVHTTTTEGVTAPPDFTTFMRNYQDMVYSTAVRLIGNETQAEDIAQEVFIKAHEHFDNLRTSPSAGMPYEDIAKKTRVSLSKVKTDILRGREALAKILVRSGASHEKFAS
jgi:DNA-directed RNA polymerase specialized sigma24 family protein